MKKLLLFFILILSISIVSGVPYLESINITPSDPFSYDDLIGSASGYSDTELFFYYKWFNNSNLYSEGFYEGKVYNNYTNYSSNLVTSNLISQFEWDNDISYYNNNVYFVYDNKGPTNDTEGIIGICNSSGENCEEKFFKEGIISGVSLLINNNNIYIPYTDSDISYGLSLSICNLSGENCENKTITSEDTRNIININNLENNNIVISHITTSNSPREAKLSICNSSGDNCEEKTIYSGLTTLDFNFLINNNKIFIYGNEDIITICNSSGDNCENKNFNYTYSTSNFFNYDSNIHYISRIENKLYYGICNSSGDNCELKLLSNNYPTIIESVKLDDGRVGIFYKNNNRSNYLDLIIYHPLTESLTNYEISNELMNGFRVTKSEDNSLLLFYQNDSTDKGHILKTNPLYIYNLNNKLYDLSSIDSSYTKEGENWTFSVLLNDGLLNSSWSNSSILINNYSFIPHSCIINSTNNYSDNNISAYCNYYVNSNLNTIFYNWKINDETVLTGNYSNINNNTITKVAELDSSYISPTDKVTFESYGVIDYYTSDTIESNELTILLQVGECNASLTSHVLDLTFKDELTGSLLDVDTIYSYTFNDGLNTYSVTGTESDSDLDFCIDYTDGFNLEVSGYSILSRENYTSRTFEFNEEPISNNPTTEKDFFLLETNESTIITYGWTTTNYEPINGVMNVYKCEDDGGYSIVSSPSIINGVAYSNIQALTQPYKYEVIYEGTTYTDEDSYSKCHIEQSEEVNYIVNTYTDILSPVVGLLTIDCIVYNTSSHNAIMTWDNNQYDTSEIEGCIIGYRQTIKGQTEVYRNCKNKTSGSFEVSIPDNNNVYFVKGTVKQGTKEGFCNGVIYYNSDQELADKIGNDGLFAGVLIIMTLALLFSGNKSLSLLINIISIIICWAIGLFTIGWVQASFIIGFIVMGIIILKRVSK